MRFLKGECAIPETCQYSVIPGLVEISAPAVWLKDPRGTARSCDGYGAVACKAQFVIAIVGPAVTQSALGVALADALGKNPAEAQRQPWRRDISVQCRRQILNDIQGIRLG